MELKQAWNFIGWMADNVPFVIYNLHSFSNTNSRCGFKLWPSFYPVYNYTILVRE